MLLLRFKYFYSALSGVGVFFMKIIATLFGFCVSLIVVRFLSVAEAGTFFFVLSVVVTLANLSTLGLTQYCIKEVSAAFIDSKINYASYIASSIMFLVFLVSCLFFVLLELIVFLFRSNEVIVLLGLMSFSLPFMALNFLFASLFQSIGKPVLGALLGWVFQPLCFCVFAYLLSERQWELSSIYVLSCMLPVFFSLMIWVKYSGLSLFFRIKSMSLPLKSCKPYAGICLVTVLSGQAPVLLGGWLMSSVELANFAVTNRIAALIGFVVISINSILSPMLSSANKRENYIELKSFFWKGVIASGFFTVLGGLFVFSLSGVVLSFYGEEYLSAKNILYVLIVGQVINGLFGPVGILLSMSGFARYNFYSKLIGLLFFVLVMLLCFDIMNAIIMSCGVIAMIFIQNLMCACFVFSKTGVGSSKFLVGVK